ncbi:MAG: hypothetical protein Q9186_001553 [Xanthomendoza sp. 1 TL-2023]
MPDTNPAGIQPSTPSDSDAAPTCVDLDPPNTKPLVVEQWHNGKAPVPTKENNAEKKFVCDVAECNKAYSRYADMTRHLDSHKTGPRAHDCVASRCPRKGMKGFWRLDKLKDHMDRKHPEIEIEPWCLWFGNESDLSSNHLRLYSCKGFRDVSKRDEQEALMRSKGYRPLYEGSNLFVVFDD